MLRIDHVIDHLPKALSQGQKQRTALARSLVGRPSLLLLDDPLRNVDAKIRYEMRLELPRVLRRYESTVIYVTQDYKEAMALGDRVAVMVDGAFSQIASPHAIYDAPGQHAHRAPVRRPADQPAAGAAAGRHGGDRDAGGGRGGAAAGGRRGTRRTRVHVRHPLREHGVSLEPTDGIPVTLDAITPLNNRLVMLLRGHRGHGAVRELPAGRADGPAARAASRPGPASTWRMPISSPAATAPRI